MARRGLSANELARALISMMARSTLQRKAGYIDARPLTTSSTKSSCYARPDHTFGSEADIALDVGQNLFPGIELLRSKKMTHASSGYCTGEHMQTEQLTWHYSRRVEIELSAGNNKTRRPWPLQSAPKFDRRASIVAPSPLRQSEEIQHRAAMMPQRQMTREEKLAAWRTGGIERGRRTHSAITRG